MQITICGGGNAAHVLAGMLSSRQDLIVKVYAPYGDEADQWRRGIEVGGGIAVRSSAGTRVGIPHRVSNDPTAVVPGSKIIFLALPAFAHNVLLQAMLPYLDEDAWIGALPARGGFDLEVLDTLNGNGHKSLVFGLQTLPWACRIEAYAREVVVLGTKAEVDLAARPASKADEIATLVAGLIGARIRPVDNFLSLTLANTGQIIHPGLMYGLFKGWDGKAYLEAPLFYQGVDADNADLLQRLSDEVQEITSTIKKRLPGLDLSAVRPLYEWLRHCYNQDISDATSLKSSIKTNRSYAGLIAPMRKNGAGLVPDFKARYLAEDVPYGLAVTRGIAELASVPTPMIDQVISWSQAHLNKEYLQDGKLRGRDVASTRAPQRYGYDHLEQLVFQVK